MDYWILWTWAKGQSPTAQILLAVTVILCGAVAALWRYVVVLHREHAEIEREVRAQNLEVLHMLTEKRNARTAQQDTDRRAVDPRAGGADQAGDPRPPA